MFEEVNHEIKNNNRFDNLLKYLKKNQKKKNDDLIEDTINYIKKLKTEKNRSFCSDKLFEDIIYIMFEIYNKDFFDSMFDKFYFTAYVLYNNIVFNEEEKENINNFLGMYKIIVNFFNNHEFVNFVNSLRKNDFDKFIIDFIMINDAFLNKNFGYNLINSIYKACIDNNPNFASLDIDLHFISHHYISKSRKYYNDDITYFYNLKNFIEEFFKIEDTNTMFNLVDNYLEYDEKQAGIYEVDEDRIKKIEKQLNDLSLKLETTDKQSNNLIQFLQDELEKSKGELLILKEKIIKDINVKSYNLVQNDDCQSTTTINLDNGTKKISTLNEIMLELRIINPNFRYTSSYDFWINFDSISMFGMTYIANLSTTERKIFAIFAHKNMLNILKEILTINSNFIQTISNNILCINIKYIEAMGIETFANLTQKQITTLTTYYHNQEYLDNFITYLKINPKFEIYCPRVLRNDVKDILDMKLVAFSNLELQKTIQYIELNILKQILDINSNFTVLDCNFITNSQIITSVGIKTIALASEEQLNTIDKFIQYSNLDKLKNILSKNSQFYIAKYTFSENLSMENHRLNNDLINYLICTCSEEELIYFYENNLFNQFFAMFSSLLNNYNEYKEKLKTSLQMFTALNFKQKEELLNTSNLNLDVLANIYNRDLHSYQKKFLKLINKKLW